MSQPALASGENYVWQGSDDTSISGSAGNFGSNQVVFTKSGDAAGGGATFTTNISYDCGGKTATSQLTITIDSTNYKKLYPTGGVVTGGDPACSFSTARIAKANVNQVTGQPTAAADNTAPACDQGSFSWLLCPAIDNVSGAISNLAKDILGPMLEIKPISPETTPDLYKTWTHMRDLAEVLFILVFFVIIAGVMFQQDIGFFNAYTIKSTLPRLVIASILVQFSFLFSALIVDIGNVLGAGVGQLLIEVTDPSKGPASFSNLIVNLVTGSIASVVGLGAIAVLASWTVAVPILLSMLLSLLAVFLTLGARYLIIAVLIAISPLALLAWVLPHTRDFAEDWFELLFKLVLMYPLITGIISLAGIINQILPFSGDTTNSGGAAIAIALIKPLVVIAAFLIIPVSFRLAGSAIHRVHSLLTGVASQGKGLIKGSELYQRGKHEHQLRKNTYMNRVLNSDTITSLQNKGATSRATAGFLSVAAAGALLGAPATKASLQRSNSSLIAKTSKSLLELKEAQNPSNLKLALAAANGDQKARADLQRSAPELLRYASTAPGREAIFNRLVDTEFSDNKDLDQFRTAAPRSGIGYFGASGNLSSEWRSLRDAGQAKRNQLPTIMQRLTEDKTYDITNRAGDKIGQETRPRGSVDINGVSKSFSKATASKLAAMSPDVYDMMRPANDTSLPANHFEKVAAIDAARGMAIGIEPAQLVKVFNPNDRNPSSMETKIAMAKALQATHDSVWEKSDEYKATHESVVKQIIQNEKMVNQLSKTAGIPDTIYDQLDAKDRALIVGEWMRNSNYSYTAEHGSDTATDIKAKAAEQRKKDYFASLTERQKINQERKDWDTEFRSGT